MKTNYKALLCFLLAVLYLVPCLKGYELNLSTDKIPKDLLKNANAVIRYQNMEVKVVSFEEINVTKKYAITILNEKGTRLGVIDEYYNKYINIDKIIGRLYDKDGIEVMKLKKKDIQDIISFNSSFFDDERKKLFSFKHIKYPYTCEYEVSTTYKYSFFLPNWMPQCDIGCSVETAHLDFEYPNNFPLRYRCYHLDDTPLLTNTEDGQKLSISATNILAKEEFDNFKPIEISYFPTIYFSSDKFMLDGKVGSMSTWKDLGRFIFKLNANRDSLPDETKKLVHNLTDTCKNQYQKISLLYEYLKKKTRYVSIQLGIGAWQTYEAKYVADKGYGDCKALSNFMKALLKEAGIYSCATYVSAGREYYKNIEMDFPSNRFNHVILCVPLKTDTIWLECTSKDLPAGYLSSFTSNRYALVTNEEGGFVVKTQTNNINDNELRRKSNITIGQNDEISGDISLIYKGILWETQKHLTEQPKSEIENYLNNKFSINTYQINNYKIENSIEYKPSIKEDIWFTGSGCVNRSGKRIFLSPKIYTFGISSPSNFEERKEPFFIRNSYKSFDTVVYHFKEKVKVEKSNNEILLEYPFATYKSNMIADDEHTIKYI